MGVEEKRASVSHDGPMPLQLVDSSTTRESDDDDDDTIPRSASAKGKSGLKIQLNLGGVKVQKMGGTEATDNDGGNKKEEPRRRPTAVR
jgi:hypothetical protein